MKYLNYLILESLKPTEIHKKYYSDIYIDTFLKISTADPTSIPYSKENKSVSKVGRYTKWMLNLYKNKKLLLEDLYKFTKTLSLFHKLNTRGILRKNKINTDINYYQSLPELWSTIKEFYNEESDEVIPVNKNEYTVIWENSKCKVIVPHTHKASCYFGNNTEWCTANDDNTHFNNYTDSGNLYIIIDKNDISVKYQFHIEDQSFADENDYMLSYTEICEVLKDYDLSDDFATKILTYNDNKNDGKLKFNISKITFEKYADNNWYLKFVKPSDCLSLFDYVGYNFILMQALKDDEVVTLIDGSYKYDKSNIELPNFDIVDYTVYSESTDKLLKFLQNLNADAFKQIDNLKMYMDLDETSIDAWYMLINEFKRLTNSKYDVILDDVLEYFENVCNNTVAKTIEDFCNSYILDKIAAHYNIIGNIEYDVTQKIYFGKIDKSKMSLIDIFAKLFAEYEEVEDDFIIFNPDILSIENLDIEYLNKNLIKIFK